MRHIRYIPSIATDSYTVVLAEEPLELHLSIVEKPSFYEISENELPKNYQSLIYESNRAPCEVALWRIRVILKTMGLESAIELALEKLPEPTKTGGKYVWQFGTTIERQSQTVFIIQQALGMSDKQLDDMFIQADAIVI